MLPIRFCFNDVSVDSSGCSLPAGQASRLVEPIVEHLDDAEWSIGPQPVENAVNVYFSHRGVYHKVRREVGVFVSHGIADKRWRDTVTPYYRATFVSGPAWTIRLLEHGAQQHTIFEVGYAKLDPLYARRAARPLNGKPVAVWAPTHGGGGNAFAFAEEPPNTIYAARSSWWHRDQILGLLDDDRIETVECPHPRHRCDGRATFDEFVRADVVIADGGSTIYEAWALGIPVVFCDWATRWGHTNGSSRGSMEEAIYVQQIGRHAAEPDGLVDAVLAAADEGITQAELDYIEPILPRAYRGVSGRLHAETLLDLADKVPAPRHQPVVTFDTFVFAGRTVKAARGTRQHAAMSRNRNWSLK